MLMSGMLMAAGGDSAKIFRYYRFYFTANNGDTYTSLQEIELATSTGGADITTSAMTCSQDVYYTPNGNTFLKCFDNNLSDYTYAVYVTDGTVLPHWGSIDVGSAMEIKEIRMWPQNYSGGPARAPKDFQFQGSTDNLSWITIKNFSGLTGWSAGTAKVLAV